MNQRSKLTFVGLGVGLVAIAWLGLIVGQVDLAPSEVWDALMGRLPSGQRTSGDAVVWSLRVPRVLAGIVIGSGLGAGGAALQGFYRNSMADPYLVGVSSAAGLGAVVGTLSIPEGGPLAVTLAAVLSGAVYAVAVRQAVRGSSDRTWLVLVGLTLGIALLAWTVIVVFVADTPRLPTFTYFIFGSLGAVSWSTLWPATGVVAVALITLFWRWRTLDLLALGESEAHHLGVHIPRAALLILGSTGAATGATVALGGVIGFVGLLAPLAIGFLVGPSARERLPAAALAGGSLVLLADLTSRAIAGPVEVPIGIVTAAVGGPILVSLIIRKVRPK